MDRNIRSQSEIKNAFSCPSCGVENSFIVNQSELLFGGKSNDDSQSLTKLPGRIREPAVYILKCTGCKRSIRVEIE